MEERESLNQHFKGVPCAGCSGTDRETTRLTATKKEME